MATVVGASQKIVDLTATGNTVLGDAAGDKVSMHGATVTNGGQIAVLSCATGSTIGTVVARMQTLLAALKTKGVMAAA